MVYPPPVKLDGKSLPWVVTAKHLGHTLHPQLSMDQDCRIKRVKFVDRTNQRREKLKFAHPDQLMKTIQIYFCDGYG